MITPMKLNEETLRKNSVVCLLAMICCALWGSAFPCIKAGYRLFEINASDTASQILFAGVRFTIAGILTIIFGSAAGGGFLKPTKSALPKIAVIALLQTVMQYFFFYVGLAHTSGVNGSIIEATNTFAAILISALIFHQERLTAKKIVGCAVGFAGVVLINIKSGGKLTFNLMGDGFVLISTITYAFSSVFLKHFSKNENPVMLSGWQFAAGGLVMTLGALAFGGRFTVFTSAGGILLIYMALISAVAYSLWGILLKYNDVSKVTVFGFMNPVFGVLLSALILGESRLLGASAVISLILVSIGIFVVNRK